MEMQTSNLMAYIDSTADKWGVDPTLAKQILLAENLGPSGKLPPTIQTDKVSSKGAAGLMQVTPQTFQGLKEKGYLPPSANLDDWQSQMDAGMASLKAMQDQHQTSDPTVIAAAYQGGNKAADLAKQGKFDQLGLQGQDYQKRIKTAGSLLNPTVPPGTTPVAVNAPAPAAISANGPIAYTGNSIVDRGISAVTDTLKNLGTQIDSFTDMVTQNTTAAEVAKLRAADSINAAGTAEGEAAKATAEITAANTRMREQILHVANMTVSAGDNEFAKALLQQQQERGTRAPLGAAIDKKMAVGFFDNPLQWLINQTQLPGMVNEFNSSVRRENDAGATLHYLQGATEAQERIDVAATADQVLKQGIATADAAKFTAAAKADALRADASAMGAQRALQLASLAETKTRLTLGTQEFLERAEERANAGKAKAGDAEEIARIDSNLKILGASVGVPNLSVAGLKLRPKAEAAQWYARADAMNMGDTFPEAFTFLNQFGNLQNMAAGGAVEFAQMFRSFNNRVNETYAAAQQEAITATGKAISVKDAKMIAAEKLQKEWYSQSSTDMNNAAKDNPYRIDHRIMATQFTGDINNPVYKMVNDAYKQGLAMSDSQILSTVDKAVAENKMTPAQAAQAIGEYYSNAIARNNKERKFGLIGLDPQQAYILKMPNSNLKFNVADPGSLENFYVQRKAKYMNIFPYSQLQGIGFGSGVPQPMDQE